MREQTLELFDRVATPAAALALWDHAPGSLEPVRASNNFVYRFVDTAGRPRYLRIGETSVDKTQAELDFVNYLSANGADVAAPVRSLAGNLVEPLETSAGMFCAVVFEGVSGEQVKWGLDAENRKLLFERGQSLGKLHRVAQSYRPSGPRRLHWYEDDLFTEPEKYLTVQEIVPRREYEELIHWMLNRPRTLQNYGMVHGDFGSFNTLRRNGGLVAFDFDDCCYHWYLYDLAVSIRSARKLPSKYRKAYLRVLVEGYASQRDLNGEGVREIAQFCRVAALYRYVSLKRKWDFSNLTEKQKSLVAERLKVLASPPEWY
jgi:Ser/Thr protein kinase RdoA (MazF antagonist)